MASVKSLCNAIILLLGVADVEGFVTPPRGKIPNFGLVHSSLSTTLGYKPDMNTEDGPRKRKKNSPSGKKHKKRVTSISASPALADIIDARRQKIRRQASELIKRDMMSALSAEVAQYSNKKKPSQRGGRRRHASEVVKATTSFAQTEFPRLLTKEEEYDLTRKVQAMRAAEKKKQELIEQRGVEPTETELAEACGLGSKSALRTIMAVGAAALDRFVFTNMGMVNSIAMKYSKTLDPLKYAKGSVGSIVSYEDLIQEGTMGLIEAINRFDPERGFRFYTYAHHWVRQRILSHMSNHARTIRLPVSAQTTLRKIRRARKLLSDETGRRPSNEEVADYLGIDAKKVGFLLRRSRAMLSLEKPIYTQTRSGGLGDQPVTLGDIISSDIMEGPDQESMIEVVARRNDVLDVVNGLPAEERDVVKARFGLEHGMAKSLAQTAKQLGTTPDRVRMLEARALNKLRHPTRNYKLREYVNLPKTAIQKKEEKAQEDRHKFFVETEEELQELISPDGIWAF